MYIENKNKLIKKLWDFFKQRCLNILYNFMYIGNKSKLIKKYRNKKKLTDLKFYIAFCLIKII